MQNSHIAVHVSERNTRVTTVIQPRNSLGQFLTPVAEAAVTATSFHSTVNGAVTRRGHLS